MKQTGKQKIKLGIFVLIGTILLISALYLIGNRQHLFTKNIELKANFTNVNGLQQGNNVRYSGIDVGTVSKIQMLSDTLISVTMLVKESQALHLKQNAIATIGSDGLVGNMIINIIPRPGVSPPVNSGDFIESYSKIGTDDMLTTLNVTNENAALLTADLLKITSAIIEGKGTLGMLIRDTLMAQDLRQTTQYLRRASASTVESLSSLNSLIAAVDMENSAAGILLTDSIQGRKLKTVFDDLQTSSMHILSLSGQMDSIARRINDGQGALNYLTEDKELVKNIDSTMQLIKESATRFNENMEALRHNFFFKSYFNKKERQERRAEKKLQKNL